MTTECVARNATRGTVLGDRVAIAESIGARLRGLLGTRELPRRHGLLIRPCKQVHSFFMQYALDLVFVDRAGRVLRTVADFRPSRVSPYVWSAASVLELPAGTLVETPAEPGDVVAIEPQTR